MPGDIIFFKAILENKTGWCCHLDGIPIKIPGEEPFCDCDNLEEAVAAGFSADFNCNLSSQILLSPRKAADCDTVIWRVYDYKNKQQVYSRTKSVPVKEKPSPGPISIFPNPTSHELNVRLAEKGLFYLSVLDWKGRRLQKHKIFSSNKDNLITLEIRDFSPGVYYLEQTDDNGNTSVFKWIKR